MTERRDIRIVILGDGLVSAAGILADFAIRMAFYSNWNRDSRDSNAGYLQLAFWAIGSVASIVAWLIGPIITAAVSRQREFLADATSAEITRYPEGLARALQKLAEYGRPMRRASKSMAHMYIADPIKPGLVERMFSTHPPIPDRIARLKKIGGGF